MATMMECVACAGFKSIFLIFFVFLFFCFVFRFLLDFGILLNWMKFSIANDLLFP
jgi:hypothetical protein